MNALFLLKAIDFAARKHQRQRRKDHAASPYINHPIQVALLLAEVGGVTDPEVLAAAVLHDTLEDTQTTPEELESLFGARVRGIVEQVTDNKSLPKDTRKRQQIEHAPSLTPAAVLVKIGDKIANVADILASPPAGWSLERRFQYLDWAEAVVAGCPSGINTALESHFAAVLAEGRCQLPSEVVWSHRVRIRVLQHVPFEGPAHLAHWAESRRHGLAITRLDRGEPLPSLDDYDWLVILGGPMGVRDEAQFPWLRPEKTHIHEAIAAGKTVIGICLGAQLMAVALGAAVRRNPQREIGWFPIERLPHPVATPFQYLPETPLVFHWHGDTFDLPEGAIHLAKSTACQNQAFFYGDRVLGLQCHLEATPDSVALLVENARDDLQPGTYVQSERTIIEVRPSQYDRLHQALETLLDSLPRL
ncbi:MAG: HD domain-containing protein [Pseudomonadota bacterium]